MILKVLNTAIDQWFRHRSARSGAAPAYYAAFSMGPLLLIVTSVLGRNFPLVLLLVMIAALFWPTEETSPADSDPDAPSPNGADDHMPSARGIERRNRP